jgi:hypothetical protein
MSEARRRRGSPAPIGGISAYFRLNKINDLAEYFRHAPPLFPPTLIFYFRQRFQALTSLFPLFRLFPPLFPLFYFRRYFRRHLVCFLA